MFVYDKNLILKFPWICDHQISKSRLKKQCWTQNFSFYKTFSDGRLKRNRTWWIINPLREIVSLTGDFFQLKFFYRRSVSFLNEIVLLEYLSHTDYRLNVGCLLRLSAFARQTMLIKGVLSLAFFNFFLVFYVAINKKKIDWFFDKYQITYFSDNQTSFVWSLHVYFFMVMFRLLSS